MTPDLEALGQRRRAELHRLVPTAGEELAQLEVELEASLTHLGRVVEGYWDREWRAEHKGLGWYPEDHLWRAARGYLDLMRGLAGRLSPEGSESDGRRRRGCPHRRRAPRPLRR